MKTQSKLIIQISFALILFITLIINIRYLYYLSLPFNQYKILASSISKGDSYFGRLQMWNYLAQRGDWSTALKIEDNLDPADYLEYKTNHQPDMIKNKIKEINNNNLKNIDEYIKLSQLYSQIGDKKSAFESIKKAYDIDPIRTDIEKLYFTFLL